MSGPTKIGKSTLLEKIYLALKEEFSIGGVITLGQEKRKFVDLRNGNDKHFSENDDEQGITIGDFLISDKAIDFATKAIVESKDKEIIIIDELGILESEKKCLYEPVRKLLNSIRNTGDQFILLCVRERVLPQILALYEMKIDDLWRISHQPDEEILDQLIRFIKNSR
ncbi:MAG: hypothetical protein KAJ72_07820 [Candidatus Heimdallarchaeota archaeon]|nr:hypothetical protein [Candidatus Heimdallarchaeota archaeon]